MGLLDDAIREHLELKRTRGADPSEVLREEREALGASGRTEAEPGAQAVARGESTNDAGREGGFAGVVETSHSVEDSFRAEGFEDAGQLPAGGEDAAEAAPGERAAESEDEAPVVRDPGHIALEQETAEVDMKAMLGVDREDDDVGPVEEPLEFEQEIPGAHDEDEPWGAPPEPTGV